MGSVLNTFFRRAFEWLYLNTFQQYFLRHCSSIHPYCCAHEAVGKNPRDRPVHRGLGDKNSTRRTSGRLARAPAPPHERRSSCYKSFSRAALGRRGRVSTRRPTADGVDGGRPEKDPDGSPRRFNGLNAMVIYRRAAIRRAALFAARRRRVREKPI